MKTKIIMLTVGIVAIVHLSGCAEIGAAVDQAASDIYKEVTKDRSRSTENQNRPSKPRTQRGATQKKAHAKYPKELVSFMQRQLNEVGYHAGNVDGIFGQATSTAIKNYQKSEGFNQTGKPNKETLTALGADQNIIALLDRKQTAPKTTKPQFKNSQEVEEKKENDRDASIDKQPSVTESIEARTIARINEATELKAKPDIYSETIADLKKGKSITINAKEGEWTHVSVDGKQGYVYSDFISE